MLRLLFRDVRGAYLQSLTHSFSQINLLYVCSVGARGVNTEVNKAQPQPSGSR